MGAREMTQWLRARNFLAEDLNWFPSATSGSSQQHGTPVPGTPMPLAP